MSPSPLAPGLTAAARFVEARRDAYDAEHGNTDPSTGAREYPGNGDEYVGELSEIADGIRALGAVASVEAVVHDDELPGMWERADFMGGATDCEPAVEPVPVAQGDGFIAQLRRENWDDAADLIEQQQATIAYHARIVAALEHLTDTQDAAITTQKAVILGLEASLAACRADAERWQWLRDQHASYGRSWHIREPSNTVAPIAIDAAIDAARAVLPLAGEASNG